MTSLIDDTTTTDPLDLLVTAALEAAADYTDLASKHSRTNPLPFAEEVTATCTALYNAVGEILGTELLATARRVRLARETQKSAPAFSYEADTDYINVSAVLWRMLLAEVAGDTLPRVTIRTSFLGRRGDITAIVLFHEPDGRLTYRRVNDQSVFCGPGTEAQMREALLHPGWKP